MPGLICSIFRGARVFRLENLSQLHTGAKSFKNASVPVRMEGAQIPEINLPHKYHSALRTRLKKFGFRNPSEFIENGPPHLLISCSEKSKDHYIGQVYHNWAQDKLASCSWKQPSTAHQHFTICNHGATPAWVGCKNKSNFDEETWVQLGLVKPLVDTLDSTILHQPTLIQRLAVPKILAGNNIICAGETGGGKTLAYLLPLIQKCLLSDKSTQSHSALKSPKAIVLCPTILLRDQILSVTKTLSENLPLNIQVLEKMDYSHNEEQQLAFNNTDILIGLPDHVDGAFKKGIISGQFVKHLIIDEADLVLDVRFHAVIRSLFRAMPIQSERNNENTEEDIHATDLCFTQVVLVGATVPQNYHNAFAELLPMSSFERLKTPFSYSVIPNISQKFIRVKTSEKQAELLKALFRYIKGRANPLNTIVFCNSKDSIMSVHKLLVENNIAHSLTTSLSKYLTPLHSFESFQKGETHVLLSTDAGAYGLDTVRATRVINYDFPNFLTDYLHRAGRVGRVGSFGEGMVISYVVKPWEVNLVKMLETCVRRRQPLPSIGEDVKEYLSSRFEF